MADCHPCCCFRHSARRAMKITAGIQTVNGLLTVVVGVILHLHGKVLTMLNPDQKDSPSSSSSLNSTVNGVGVGVIQAFFNLQYLIDASIPIPIVFLSPVSIGLGIYLWLSASKRTDAKCRSWRFFTATLTMAYVLLIFECLIDAVNKDVEVINLGVYLVEISFNIYLMLVVSQFLGVRSPEPSVNNFELQ